MRLFPRCCGYQWGSGCRIYAIFDILIFIISLYFYSILVDSGSYHRFPSRSLSSPRSQSEAASTQFYHNRLSRACGSVDLNYTAINRMLLYCAYFHFSALSGFAVWAVVILLLSYIRIRVLETFHKIAMLLIFLECSTFLIYTVGTFSFLSKRLCPLNHNLRNFPRQSLIFSFCILFSLYKTHEIYVLFRSSFWEEEEEEGEEGLVGPLGAPMGRTLSQEALRSRRNSVGMGVIKKLDHYEEEEEEDSSDEGLSLSRPPPTPKRLKGRSTVSSPNLKMTKGSGSLIQITVLHDTKEEAVAEELHNFRNSYKRSKSFGRNADIIEFRKKLKRRMEEEEKRRKSRSRGQQFLSDVRRSSSRGHREEEDEEEENNIEDANTREVGEMKKKKSSSGSGGGGGRGSDPPKKRRTSERKSSAAAADHKERKSGVEGRRSKVFAQDESATTTAAKATNDTRAIAEGKRKSGRKSMGGSGRKSERR